MPKVDKIAVVYERKLNLGNYESATVGASAWIDLDEGDDPARTFDETFAMCRDAAAREAVRIMAKTAPKNPANADRKA